MPVGTDYTLSDLLLFSPETYFRLFERANTLWPLGLLLALPVLAAVLRPAWLRLAPVALAVASALVAGWFLQRFYAPIHLAAGGYALAFAIEALLLALVAWRGITGDAVPGPAASPGLLLAAYALVLHPLVIIATGRAWRGTELFAIAPDPTALATLGLLLAAPGRWRWLAVPIPMLWCLVSGLTWLAMDRPGGLLLPLAAAAALVWHLRACRMAHRLGSRPNGPLPP